MTNEQLITCRNLANSVLNGDLDAPDALHDFICELGFPNVAKYHHHHLSSMNSFARI